MSESSLPPSYVPAVSRQPSESHEYITFAFVIAQCSVMPTCSPPPSQQQSYESFRCHTSFNDKDLEKLYILQVHESVRHSPLVIATGTDSAPDQNLVAINKAAEPMRTSSSKGTVGSADGLASQASVRYNV